VSHANWYSTGELALQLKLKLCTISRRIRLGQIPAVYDSYMEMYFIHKNVYDFVLETYQNKVTYSQAQITHMKQLHDKALYTK